MRSNSSIYVFPFHSMFNIDEIPLFENFDKNSSRDLYSALVSNHEEVLRDLQPGKNIFYCFDKKDKGYLPEKFAEYENSIIWNESSTIQSFLIFLSEKYFNSFSNNLLIFNNSIGYTSKDIAKAFDLLAMEDEALVAGKSGNGNLAFLGFNSWTRELLKAIELQERDFDKLLSIFGKHDYFLHVLGNYLTIQSLDDFKQLYHELSKKESLAYCSHQIHELFTNLFIEYKGLIK